MSFTSARRDVSLIVVAKSVSWLGDLLAEVALVLRLQSHGAGAGAVAALLVANAMPIVLLSGVVGGVVALVALLGAGQAVNSACWQALLPTVVSGDALTRAIGRTQAGQMMAGIG